MNPVLLVLILCSCLTFALWRWFKWKWCQNVFFVGCFLCLFGVVHCRFYADYDAVLDVADLNAIEGVYVLADGSSEELLSRMGYRDCDGRIILRKGGLFDATRIPACMIHGYDESVYSYEDIERSVYGGYYDALGSWCLVKKSDGCFVELDMDYALLNETLDCVKVPLSKRSRLNDGSLGYEHRLLRDGDAFVLEFLIFNGDFEKVYFLKSGAAEPVGL